MTGRTFRLPTVTKTAICTRTTSMIQRIKLLRNIGTFCSDSAAATCPLNRLVLLHGENGSGKTTLAAILRSLAASEPLPINERHRLGAKQDPKVVLQCETDPPTVMFQNGSWDQALPNIKIFDDVFVDNNVYSGLVVDSKHRQQLHDLIIGAQGVALQRRVEDLVSRIEQHNKELQAKTKIISQHIQGRLSVDQFCELPNLANLDSSIEQTNRSLNAINNQESIRAAQSFQTILLPEYDIAAIQDTLAKDLPTLDKAAETQVLQHLQTLDAGGEAWVAAGIEHMAHTNSDDCPFCGQGTAGVTLIQRYRAFFSDNYTALKQNVSDLYDGLQRVHGGSVQAGFERAVAKAKALSEYWAQYCQVPAIDLDTEAITSSWTTSRDLITAFLKSKQASPLEPLCLSRAALEAVREYNSYRSQIAELNQSLITANSVIDNLRDEIQNTNKQPILEKLEVLQATKLRYSTQIEPLCAGYLQEKKRKSSTEIKRQNARAELNDYRTNIFPTLQKQVNYYLQRFNAGFRIDSLTPTNIGGGSGSTCTYELKIRDVPIAVRQAKNMVGKPSFRNTLSAGDRNTLALALFFSSLDQDPNISDSIVVIDDPISSLDDHRSMTTIQEVRNLAKRVNQMFLMSHNKSFLCSVWDRTDHSECVSLRIALGAEESTITSWDIKRDAITEHDLRHSKLQTYADTGSNASRELAQSIRLHLEGFLRVAFPGHFPPECLLGRFISMCHENLGRQSEVLSTSMLKELKEITEYANRFHHDTNPAWATTQISSIELRGYVKRTLSFVRPKS